MDEKYGLMDLAKVAYGTYKSLTPEEKESVRASIKEGTLEDLEDLKNVIIAPIELIAITAYVGANILYDRLKNR
jgi:hypothetical protein